MNTRGQQVVPRFEGVFFDEFAPDSGWLRESGSITLPPNPGGLPVRIEGEIRAHPDARSLESGFPGLELVFDGQPIVVRLPSLSGPWDCELSPVGTEFTADLVLRLTLTGVGMTNALAWLGRVLAKLPGSSWLQRFRRQARNRQLRIGRILYGDVVVWDFGNRHQPFNRRFGRLSQPVGINIVGFFRAHLGVAESARCMVRAADAAELPSALIELRLNCLNRSGDETYAARLQGDAPYPVNVIHLDAPASRDIEHHHGPGLKAHKYNIGYWAWELPEFPEIWAPYFACFDEIWCPSEFVREAIAMKSPIPVITMPHAIDIPAIPGDRMTWRAHFSLPPKAYLFLFLYDLNSYSARKNPDAVIAAFRASGLADAGAALVIKTHSVTGNEAAFATLQAAVAELPGTTLISESLSRTDLYGLEIACDCFVSLHRSEGFGLAVAECMALGKPVIATDWSATSEFLDASTGCPVPVKLVELERNHGPYAKGQIWAEPDIHAAAEWMRGLHADPARGEALGRAAKSRIREKFSPRVIGQRYRQRLEGIRLHW